MARDYALNAARAFILISFTWIFYTNWDRLSVEDILLVFASIVLAIPVYWRTFLLDKYFRTVHGFNTLTFIQFYNRTPTYRIITLSILLKPLPIMATKSEAEIIRKRIQMLTYTTYSLLLLYAILLLLVIQDAI